MCFFRKKSKAIEEPKQIAKEKPKFKYANSKVTIIGKKIPDPRDGRRVYHVSKRQDDGLWQVKFAGSEKAIKLFKTKAEAEEYTKQMAKNQDGVMLSHNSKGANKGRIAKK